MNHNNLDECIYNASLYGKAWCKIESKDLDIAKTYIESKDVLLIDSRFEGDDFSRGFITLFLKQKQ